MTRTVFNNLPGAPAYVQKAIRGDLVMSRRILLATLIVGLLAASARAQLITAGSTPEGDYLRGLGIAGWGLGLYNLNTAQAESINVDTYIRFDQYVGEVVKAQTREYVARKMFDAQKLKQFYNDYRKHILESPEARDILVGDALNDVLRQLLDPKVSESTFRAVGYQVPLPIDWMRRIPFALSEKGERFSMDRLSLKGKGKWSVALQDDRFQREKRAYERALDKALEQATDGKMQIAAIEEVDARADDLFRKLNEVVGPTDDRLYVEAKERLTELQSTVRLLKTEKIERAIGELSKYSGTTINDLKLFMQRHNLRFAAAKTPEERSLFPELYARLVQQRDKVVPPDAEPPQ
jgi:hypothetical protein